MQWMIFDCEVTQNDWIVVAKYYKQDKYLKFHNDYVGLRQYLDDENIIWIGFNVKGYDQFILKAIYNGYDNKEIKSINDKIIMGVSGYDLNISYCKLNICDLMDDMQIGTSLKSIEGHLGMNIQESSIPFDIKRSLTENELVEMINYCTADVNATEKVCELREPYLQTKINLGVERGLTESQSLSMTNAKLTSAFLGAKKPDKPYTDEREYKYPDNLRLELIPKKVIQFYDDYIDEKIPLDTVLKETCELKLGDCEITISWGGIHGVVRNTIFKADDNKMIVNLDVSSYYPSMMILYDYLSRNIDDKKIFETVKNERIKAKHNGDVEKANNYKLIINTTYGATLNQYNDLYDPLKARSICISGQLFLLELTMSCLKVPTLQMIQLNTDGIAFEVDRKQWQKVFDIIDEWQQRTEFELEIDYISEFIQKDVNNYIMLKSDGSLKTKGSEFKKGINLKGAFSINNNNKVISKALIDYFTKGISVKDTIMSDNNILDFMMISKASSKYKECYTYQYNKKVPLQKVNRVYASNNANYSTLFKVAKANNLISKIADLPEHCIIDNDNHLTIDDINKQWYIDKAIAKVKTFIKERSLIEMVAAKETTEKVEQQPKEKQLDTTKLNVYQKLIKVRHEVLKSNVQKSGKNFGLTYSYFELGDILPVAIPLMDKYGLLTMFNMDHDWASLQIINVDNPTELVNFTIPVVKAQTNKGTTEIQALGSTETYLRRYLYMTALDICENDEVDSDKKVAPTTTVVSPKPISIAPTQTVEKATQPISIAPVTSPKPIENREQAKLVLTQNANQLATNEQKQTLKDACNKLLEITKHNEQTTQQVDKIYKNTDNLNKLSSTQFEMVLAQVNDQIKKMETDPHPELPF